jgi:hypothetical protein
MSGNAKTVRWISSNSPRLSRDHVSLTVPASTTDAEILTRIAAESHSRIEGSLPQFLYDKHHTRGKTISTSVANAVRQILDNHPNLCWSGPGEVWKFAIRNEQARLSPCEELAGSLMRAARAEERNVNKYLPKQACHKIFVELSRKGFKPKDALRGKGLLSLDDWNRNFEKNDAEHEKIDTLPKAFANRRLNRPMRLFLNNAEKKYKRKFPES